MDPQVQIKYDAYPKHIKPKVLELRALVFGVAEALDLGEVHESLKWGEPSYQVKSGSPVRLDWKPKYPDKYLLFFHCQTKLVDTFRELYSESLEFEGNRAIVLYINKDLPETIIRHCLELAMRYKELKHLTLLGA